MTPTRFIIEIVCHHLSPHATVSPPHAISFPTCSVPGGDTITTVSTPNNVQRWLSNNSFGSIANQLAGGGSGELLDVLEIGFQLRHPVYGFLDGNILYAIAKAGGILCGRVFHFTPGVGGRELLDMTEAELANKVGQQLASDLYNALHGVGPLPKWAVGIIVCH